MRIQFLKNPHLVNYSTDPEAEDCSEGEGARDSVGGGPPGGVGVPGGGAQLVGALGFSGFTWQLVFAPVDSNRMA